MNASDEESSESAAESAVSGSASRPCSMHRVPSGAIESNPLVLLLSNLVQFQIENALTSGGIAGVADNFRLFGNSVECCSRCICGNT